jgi:hypothetical protein
MEKKKFFTVSKADVFHKELNMVIFSVEASHINHRVVTFETDNLQLINVINKVEHASVADAHAYIKTLA